MIHCFKDYKGYYTLNMDKDDTPTKIIYTLEENGIYNVEIHCPFKDHNRNCIVNGTINLKTKKLQINNTKLIVDFKENDDDTLYSITIEDKE